MKQRFKAGDKRKFQRTVRQEDVAKFDSGLVHPVYSTFAIARDAEWTCRLFVLEMKDTDEEGIGAFINVEHHSPALVGEPVDFEATVESIRGNEIICSFEAKAGGRLVASGRQGQRILKKEKINSLFEKLRHG